ncbi:MAG: PrgI family protein [Candidatus Kaiserbacteria bacterium]|nr:PrgI family protein [Candidatus Kaiserbacteria bacterium]
MRFEVPQFIEIEDKIVGPLTWRQFVYVAGGVGIITILYLSTSFMITILLGLPIGALSASLAFHKVNNRPFSIFLEALVSYTAKKKLYLWRKETPSSVIEKNYEAVSPAPKLSNTYGQTITSLSHKLEHHLPE